MEQLVKSTNTIRCKPISRKDDDKSIIPSTQRQTQINCLNASTQQLDQPARGPRLWIKWEDFIGRFLPMITGLFFVQVGAGCGTNSWHCAIGGDPIWLYATRCNWQGVVIEPVESRFGRLCHNYAKYPGITPLRLAVSNYSGWSHILGDGAERNSLISSQLSRPDNPHYRLVNESVVVATLDMVWKWQSLNVVHILAIDAEGGEESILGHGDLPRP
eukprot:CAMPEP_0119317110 /NCGR_PEP_ID=MMETSP1333-20130426/41999_1 /TAXON_ID=418940 /ORGANISM="Scyphosphaera apsteinii, Strain RCC1455" /LENGTH=215 /DNA_ID=CAMNT_0007322949 /DNA_START=56 /DNA_END=700 /DNA_ORIENTATION=-